MGIFKIIPLRAKPTCLVPVARLLYELRHREIDRLFRQSGLYRPKWDEPHFAGGKTYGQATIEKAVSSADERYAKPGQSSHRAAGQREFHLTDLGNAERLVHHFGDRIRYCHLWKKWLIWDDVRWVVDHTDRIRQLAKQVIRKIYSEAETVSDLSKRQAIAKHAIPLSRTNASEP